MLFTNFAVFSILLVQYLTLLTFFLCNCPYCCSQIKFFYNVGVSWKITDV